MSLLTLSTATATVAANTNSIAISGLDLTSVYPGMTITLGARDRKTGDAYIVATVTPTGTSGGTLTTQGSIPAASTNTPFLIDTLGYQGTDASYAASTNLQLLQTLLTLLGPNTNLYSGSKQLALDKLSSTALGRILCSTAGRTWADLVHRPLSYTPTGGAAVTGAETLALRAFPDGSTPVDALLIDLATGGGDLRKASASMASATTTDLGSAPVGKVTLTGSAVITSFGPGKHLERLVHVADGGATLTHSASLILPGAANIVTRAGDCFHATSDSSGGWRVRGYQRADGTALAGVPLHAQGRCRLVLANSANLRLDPYDGNILFVGGSYATVPTGGVVLSNTGLVAGTLYYVYAYLASGVLTLEASTTGYVTDGTYGHKIKSGDATRTLVGMAYTDTGTPGIFADQPTKRYVASYFGRRDRTLSAPYTSGSTTSSTAVEITTALRSNFLTWSDEIVEVFITGAVVNSTAGQGAYSYSSFDGATYGIQVGTSATANAAAPVACFGATALSEGLHYATLFGGNGGGGTATWSVLLLGKVRS